MFRLDGRTAVVTGAGQNTGAGIAETLAAQGAHVFVNDVVADRADEVAARLRDAGGSAEALPFDVTDLEAVRAALAERPIDILVNNAGNAGAETMRPKPFAETEPSEWNGAIAVNLGGVMHCTHAVLPGMIERGHGRVIGIVSGAGTQGVGIGVAAYSAGKGGAAGLLRSVALEVAATGVTVNSIALGLMDNTGGFGRDRAARQGDSDPATRHSRRRRRALHLSRLGRGIVDDRPDDPAGRRIDHELMTTEPNDVPPIDDWNRLLAGKVAVVTGGGADGIGGAITELFAAHGASRRGRRDRPGPRRRGRRRGHQRRRVGPSPRRRRPHRGGCRRARLGRARHARRHRRPRQQRRRLPPARPLPRLEQRLVGGDVPDQSLARVRRHAGVPHPDDRARRRVDRQRPLGRGDAGVPRGAGLRLDEGGRGPLHDVARGRLRPPGHPGQRHRGRSHPVTPGRLHRRQRGPRGRSGSRGPRSDGSAGPWTRPGSRCSSPPTCRPT